MPQNFLSSLKGGMRMIKRVLVFSGTVIVLFFSATLFASKFPSIPFSIAGKVIDLDTKGPLSGVNVLIFLNDHSYADNDGWTGDKFDYPNLPSSDPNGNYEGRSHLYRGAIIELKKVEVIALKPGYRTERFVFLNPKFSLSADRLSGSIQLPDIAVLKNRNSK
jgi:hypothetical protein